MYFEVKNISVNYDRVRAVRNVSISMEEGETVALIGANGAGKSSTLRAITGLKKLSGGEIWFDGTRIDTLPSDQIVRRGVAMVPEGRRVFPLMSVKDNLLMGAFTRHDKKAIAADLDGVLAKELKEPAFTFPFTVEQLEAMLAETRKFEAAHA